MDGSEVVLAGWVHEIRDLGGVKFVILRDKTGLIQIILKKGMVDEETLELGKKLIKETAITCKGAVKSSKIAPGGREIIPKSMEVVGPVLKQVPFEVTGKVPADLDVRLNNRFIDLRRPETQAIFKVRSEVLKSFREKLVELGFQEINPPCIVGSATEGGTDLFPVVYFEREAFLAQSPQLYKQLAIMGGMDKVFMITPIFRAEKHNTTSHLNEAISMDIEMGWTDERGVMDVLEKVFLQILSNVKENCSNELQLLNVEVNVPASIPRYTYTKAIEKLNEAGVEIKWGGDFSKEHERKLWEVLGEELFFVHDWPTQVRAFYTMPYEDDESICHSFDLFYRGLEMVSGGQRIHIPDLLIKRLKAKGLKPASFESYIDSFRYGAIPHGGFGLGAERLTMALTKRTNIRECALFPRDRTRLTP
jgi:aspartyl-tRNA synthetase